MKKSLLLILMFPAFAIAQTCSVTISTADTSICANDSIQICATPGFASYRWNSGQVTECIYARFAGNYEVTADDGAGCIDTSNQITITVLPVPPVSIIRVGDTLSTFGGAAYQWYINGQAIPGATSQVFIATANGFYQVELTGPNGCKGISSPVTIGGFPGSRYYVFLNKTYPNCDNNGSISTFIYGGAPPYNYQWSSHPGQNTSTISHLSPGVYSLTVTDASSHSVEASVYLASGCKGVIEGGLYLDANLNCQADFGEARYEDVLVVAEKDSQSYYSRTDGNGRYSILVQDTGAFRLKAAHSFWNTSCKKLTFCGDGNLEVQIDNMGDTVTRHLGVESNSTDYDLTLNPLWNAANPGFVKNYTICYLNNSLLSFTGNATVMFKYDPNLIYISSTPAPLSHNTSTRTLTWSVNDVPNPKWDLNHALKCSFTVPATLATGYYIQSDFSITPTADDCDITNNNLHFDDLLRGSFDPNEKEVSPAGNILATDSVLTYTIHFQNTGSDTTWFVILKDTLSSYLDPASVQNIAFSHPYSEFSVTDHGILTWVFDPMYLVDSATNEPESKAFVKFRVKRKMDLPLGTIIQNKASIYFDYNEPIVTNTATNIYTNRVGIQETYGDNKNQLNLYPNPATAELFVETTGFQPTSISIFDMNGRKLSEEKFTSPVDVSSLSAGVYFVEVKSVLRQAQQPEAVRKRWVKM